MPRISLLEPPRNLAHTAMGPVKTRISLPSLTSKRRVVSLAVIALVATCWLSVRWAPVVFAQTFTVTNTNDSGAGSLRQAILDANGRQGNDSITFNIPSSDPGFNGLVFTIKPLSALPTLTDNGTTIDGATQTAFTGETNAAGPEILLNGGLMGFSGPFGGGLNIPSSGNRINSLVINGFNNTGISITGAGATGNLVTGCYLGTNASGTAAVPNSFDGMVITQGASNNVVGGASLADRNVISGNARNGLTIGLGTNNNTVQGNFVGTDVTGTMALRNAGDGIQIGGTANGNLIGGTSPGARNLISGNGANGISVINSDSTTNQVQGNFIGTNAAGTAAIGNAFSGVLLRGAPNNTVGGTANGAGNLISGNLSNGINIVNASATGNQVQGNFIGTNAQGNGALGNLGNGIDVNNSSNNVIGGTTAAARNIISGNGGIGINISGAGSIGNVVQGNYIGTDVNGGSRVGNGGVGVFVNGAANNVIGGTAAGAGNVISGNSASGVGIFTGATGTLVQGNYIGTNAAGTAALGNLGTGLGITNSFNNVIGGSTAAARNIISGNISQPNGTGYGIVLGGNAISNIVSSNYIGTDVSGTQALPNGRSGVLIYDGSKNNTIGGATTTPGGPPGNLISGNAFDGISILGASGTFLSAPNNVVQGNLIGTNAAGTAAIANASAGIRLVSDNNVIGGAGAANAIAFNNFDGVFVFGGTGNAIQANAIFSNAGLGISLTAGGNNNQTTPILSALSSSGGNTSIQGTLSSTPSQTFSIQFFANDSCDPSGAGEGQIFLGSTSVSTDANGKASFNVTLPGNVVASQVVTATATDANNNTSAFSVCRPLSISSNFQISGHVSDPSGNSLSGILILLNGSATTTTTNSNGDYTLAGLAAGGNYTVAPSSNIYAFNPTSQTFNSLNLDRIANFVGTQTVVTISGQVTDANNLGQANVIIALTKNGVAAGTAQTNAGGNYSFGNLQAGANYLVTPAGSFTPSNQTLNNLTANATVNFKAAPSIPPQCATASFAAATNFAAGLSPQSVAVGDFNGDGRLDLAAANNTSANVSILLGTGTGSFSPASNFAVGLQPYSVAVGDFNGDGRTDLAVANNGTANISILLGTGIGTFSTATNLPVGDRPESVAVGDFNGDGKSDLAVANTGSDNISILLGTGTGTFAASTNFAAGIAPSAVAVGDFNGDGKLDLAVTNLSGGADDNVSIMLGTGVGSFGTATNFAVGDRPESVAVGDFNGDGKPDLAVANDQPDNISILLGTGTGSFGAKSNFPVGTGPFSVALGDFNGDGKLDLATANSSSNNVSILLGTGTGSFTAATNFAVGKTFSVTGGDFNGDGKLDLAAANASSNSVSILLNDGSSCNTQNSLSISGQISDAKNNPLIGVTVTLSGPITRVVQTDASGNYAFSNLTPGGNYAVTLQSPYFIFAPSRADFFNLGGSQTANFTAAPVAVPSPTPPANDDFTSTTRDATKWSLGTQTEPTTAFDPQVTTTQVNGQLVLTPLTQAVGLHYNGYVSANAFDMRNGSATVEVVKAAGGGADTIFAIGSDADNFARFMVHTPTAPTLLALTAKGMDGIERQLSTTVAQLVFQVNVGGQISSLSIDYDPVLHRYMRFRHEAPSNSIVFETSPNNIDFVERNRVVLQKGVSALTAELSAGTSSPTNPGPAVFDNFALVTSTFQFSGASYAVGEADGSVLVTVTRSGSTADAATVGYTTTDGTAAQSSKYITAAGTLSFAPGQTSRTFNVLIVDNALTEGNQALNLVLANPVGSGLNSPGRAVLTIVDNDTTSTPQWQAAVLTATQINQINTWTISGRTYVYVKPQFPNAGYRVVDWGQPSRAGNDFTADAAVERFTGPSVQAVTTTAQIYDLGVVADGNYTFTFKNSGTVVKSQAFTVNSTTVINPINNEREFVKQQYRDFLNREADQAGEDFWTDNITKCSDPARRPAGQTVDQCTLRQRETTSGAFFLSPEFQYTGYYVLRVYQGALGRPPKLSEFTPDTQFVGNGILVNSQLSAAKINQNKADFAQQFVNCTDATKYRCAEFKTLYDGLNNQQYVDKLFQTTGVNASASDRAALVNGLNGGSETRASVLQKVVDGITVIGEGNQQFTTSYGQAFYNSELNRAFVQLEYFGYMKRDPDEAGFAFWLGKLNQFSGNFINAEMVLAFISSPEYRARFGQP